MKKYILIATLFFISSVNAQVVDVRVIEPDKLMQGTAKSTFSEGTETKLNPQQMEEIRRWANYSRNLMVNVERNGRTMTDKAQLISYIHQQIQKAVAASQKENSELLMRYVLNRALVIYDILNRETDNADVGTLDMKLMLLEESVKMAMRYYDHDQTYLSRLNPENTQTLVPPFATFGVDYAQFLSRLANSVLDASAQYQLYRLVLGLYHWDLYRDNERLKYADYINRIHDFLEGMPQPNSDATALQSIRQLKRLLQETMVKSPQESLAASTRSVGKEDTAKVRCELSRFSYVIYWNEQGRAVVGYVQQTYGGEVLSIQINYENGRGVDRTADIPCPANMGLQTKCIGKICQNRQAVYSPGGKGTTPIYRGSLQTVFDTGYVLMNLSTKDGVKMDGLLDAPSSLVSPIDKD